MLLRRLAFARLPTHAAVVTLPRACGRVRTLRCVRHRVSLHAAASNVVPIRWLSSALKSANAATDAGSEAAFGRANRASRLLSQNELEFDADPNDDASASDDEPAGGGGTAFDRARANALNRPPDPMRIRRDETAKQLRELCDAARPPPDVAASDASGDDAAEWIAAPTASAVALDRALTYFRRLKSDETSVVHWNIILRMLKRHKRIALLLQYWKQFISLNQPPIVIPAASAGGWASLSAAERSRYRLQPNVQSFTTLMHALAVHAYESQRRATQPILPPASATARLLTRLGGGTTHAPAPEAASLTPTGMVLRPDPNAASDSDSTLTPFAVAAGNDSRVAFERLWHLYSEMCDVYQLRSQVTVPVFTTLLWAACHQLKGSVQEASIARVWSEYDAAVTALRLRGGDSFARKRLSLNHGMYHVMMCHYADTNRFGETLRYADLMISRGLKPTLHTYGLLLRAFVKFDKPNRIFQCLESIRVAGMRPNRVIWNTALSYFASKGNVERVEWICDEMRNCGIAADQLSFHAIIYAFAKSGQSDRAVDSFERLKRERPQLVNVQTYNILLSAFAEPNRARTSRTRAEVAATADAQTSDLAVAHRYWEELRRVATPTLHSANNVLKIMGRAGNTERILGFFAEILHSGLRPNDNTRTLLLHAYSRVGDAKGMIDALRFWNTRLGVTYLPVTSYTLNTIIAGLLHTASTPEPVLSADDGGGFGGDSAGGDESDGGGGGSDMNAHRASENEDLAGQYLRDWSPVINIDTCNLLLTYFARTNQRTKFFTVIERIKQLQLVPNKHTIYRLEWWARDTLGYRSRSPATAPTHIASGSDDTSHDRHTSTAAAADRAFAVARDVSRWDSVRVWYTLLDWSARYDNRRPTVEAFQTLLRLWSSNARAMGELDYGTKRRAVALATSWNRIRAAATATASATASADSTDDAKMTRATAPSLSAPLLYLPNSLVQPTRDFLDAVSRHYPDAFTRTAAGAAVANPADAIRNCADSDLDACLLPLPAAASATTK